MGCWTLFLKLIWKLFLATLGFLIGLCCSLLFYEFVLRETEFNDAYKVLMFLSTAIFLSFGFAFSRQIACMTLLTLPEFASRAGRRSLQATILILVLAGPLKNLGENGEETLRFLACIKDMLWEIFMAGVDLVLAPIQHILSDIKNSADEKGQDGFYNKTVISHLLEPIQEEIEGDLETLSMKEEGDEIDRDSGIPPRSLEIEAAFTPPPPTADESERVVSIYKKKLAYRCEEIFTKGTLACISIFQGKHEECKESVGFALAWILCWPMKMEFICDILSDFSMGSTCDVGKVVDQNFGETYTFVRKGIDDFTSSFKFRINYQGLAKIVNLDEIKTRRDELLEHFLESKRYVEWYLTLIKRSLTLSYLLVLFSALNYHKHYLSKLSFDNVYITPSFRRIDERRKREGKGGLLPLKTFEQCEMTKVTRFLLTEGEWKKFGTQFISISLQVGVVFTIFALDFIYKELLLLLQNHAEIQIRQEGVHVLAIQVKGEGFLAQLLRRVVKDFSTRKEIDMTHFTKPCLPIPKETAKAYSQRVFVLFAVLFVNAYFQAHCSRVRHCIADFFYKKRYKKRAVWLYNETLRRRRRKMAHLKRKVLENADKFRIYIPYNPFQLLSHFFPKACACLRRWKVGRRKCILCLANGSLHHCPRCGFSYCTECFTDVGQRCLLCIAEREEMMRQREKNGDVTINNDDDDDVDDVV
ncbi:unnamed protein product [Orchesella dallaii]|uniref:Dendritic cell-specific transmembrane protein-like domain-containing protein n=1 Tax=Orchesella dallaii TaxID=48710 RepID=A0ABP1PLU9_9HEXA